MHFKDQVVMAILSRLKNTASKESRVADCIVYTALCERKVTDDNGLMATIYMADLSAVYGLKSGSLYARVKNACNRGYSGATVYDWCYANNNGELRPIICNALYCDGICTIEFDMAVLELSQNVYMELKESGALEVKNDSIEDLCTHLCIDIEEIDSITDYSFFHRLRKELE